MQSSSLEFQPISNAAAHWNNGAISYTGNAEVTGLGAPSQFWGARVQRAPSQSDFAPVVNASIGSDQLRAVVRNTALTKRLIELDAALYEDYDRSIDPESRRGFEQFMAYYFRAVAPKLAAESTGKLVATWVRGPDCLTLRFNGQYRFHFAITATGANGVERQWGEGHTLNFLDASVAAERLVYDRS